MSEQHTLALKIDAQPAEAGARRFKSAVDSVKAAVRDLDRDTTGAFKQLRKVDTSGLAAATTETKRLAASTSTAEQAATKMANQLRTVALSSANALRVSTDQASRLRDRLLHIGDDNGLARLNAGLAQLKMSLTNATTGLDVREARATYSDLASELNRSAREAERLRAEAIGLARAEEDAANAAQRHAAQLETLANKHNPLRAASMSYAAALSEVDQLVAANMLTEAQASAARERAAQSYLSLGAAADQASMATGRVSAASTSLMYNLQDVGVMMAAGQNPFMMAMQQGTQIAGAFEASGVKGKKAFDLLKTAATSLVSPVSLLSVGFILFSATAVQAAQAAYTALSGLEGKVIDVGDALDKLDSSITAARDAASRTSDFAALREEYGRFTQAVKDLVAAQRELSNLDAASDLRTLRDSLAFSSGGGVGWMEALAGYADTEAGRVRKIRDELTLTWSAAQKLEGLFRQSEGASSARDMADMYARIRAELVNAVGGVQNLNTAQRETARQLTEAEALARRLAAAEDGSANAANNAAGAASNLTYTIGTAADEAARLLANLNSVPGAIAVMGKSVADQISAIRDQNKALNLELSEGLSSAAANRRVQLQTMISTAHDRGQRINVDQVAKEWKAINELDAAAKEQERLRKAISDANRPAKKGHSGGGRASALTDEAKAIQKTTDALSDRLSGLESERISLALLATGQVQNAETAKLMADAMVANGGAIDAATVAMARQIDAGVELNKQLTALANNPAKTFADSAGTWVEAGNRIEAGVIGNLRDGFRNLITGEFSIENVGNAILGTVADVMSDKATQELLNLFNLTAPDAPTLGQALGGAMGEQTDAAQLAAGSQQAGQTISAAMVQAGQTVSQQIGAAMTSGGSTAGQYQQQAMAVGGQQAANATRAAGIMHGQQVRMASAQGGQQLGRGVVTGAQQGAPILASGVASGAAGGGAGGGILSAVGGWQGILSMALGAFKEGGISTAPVGMASMPISAFRNAPHYAEGTSNTSGIPAVLHPNEAVIPLSRGRKIPVELGDAGQGGSTINQQMAFHITTPDADSFRRSKDQIAADMAAAGQRAARKNR